MTGRPSNTCSGPVGKPRGCGNRGWRWHSFATGGKTGPACCTPPGTLWKSRPATYISEGDSWGPLPYDLAALASYRLGDRAAAAEYGQQALRLAPGDARLLEGCGCTALAIPCNPSHSFADRLQGEIGVPIIHMLRETAKLLAANNSQPPITAQGNTTKTTLEQLAQMLEEEGIQTQPHPW